MTDPNDEQPAAPRAYGPVPPQAVVPPPDSGIPRPLRPEHLYKSVGLLFLLALVLRFFDQITHVFLVGYAAAILAVALNVLIHLFPVQRRWAAAGMGVVIVGLLGVLFWLGLPALMEQVRDFAKEAPRFQAQLREWGEWLRQRTGLNVDLLGERTQSQLRSVFGGMRGQEMLGHASGVLEIIFIPLIILFGGLFAVGKPNERLLSPLLRAVPRDRRLAFRRLFELLGIRIRGWVRGTLLAMLAVGVLSTLAYSLIGVRYALLLGLVAGIVEVLPLIGPWIGGLLAVLVALVDDPSKALWTLGAVVAIQQLESNVITPLVMARAAEVHPFVTLFALLLFGKLFGFLGLLLSIPLVLLFWTLIEVLWVERAIDTDEDPIAPVVEE